MLASIGFGMGVSYLTGGIMGAGLVVAVLYSLRRDARAWRVLDFPLSKILVITVGWTFSLACLPALENPGLISAGWIISMCVVCGLIFFRTGLTELKDIQGERIVGRRTLPIVVGKEQTEALLGAICAGLGVVLVSASLNGWVEASFGYAMLVPVAYAAVCLHLYRRKIQGHGGLTEAAADQ